MANRSAFHKHIALFLAALLLFSMMFAGFGATTAKAVSNSEIEQLEAEKQSIRDEKIEAANKAAALRDEKAAWVVQKAAYDEQNRLAQEEILKTQEQIEILNELMIESEAKAKAAEAAADEVLETYKKRLRSMEENGKLNTYIGILFESSNVGDMLSRMDAMSEIMEHDMRIEQQYKDAYNAAVTSKAEYEELRVAMEAKQIELNADIERLEMEIAEADAMIAELEKQIDEYMAIYNAALLREAAVQQSINYVIAQLKAAEEAAKQAELFSEEDEMAEESSAAMKIDAEALAETENLGESASGTDVDTETFAAPDTSTVTGEYIWPLPSGKTLNSLFGNRVHPVSETTKFHKGIDISAKVGAPILAADGGTVITADNDPAGYGIYVVIYHSEGRSTLYAHMSSSAVETGDLVTQGQIIGYAGSSGMSTGPHLHFEVAIDGELQDPLDYFDIKLPETLPE